ncbi:hypothetical protein BLNAU_5117 [Blattamonas nauphoetae]|uniref:Uncharacterized protein n=1 Tax=Blattamonas nauphoetae TaxID=2049346 RepID=A0ABQ9Y846_9EUKA|nr:hypothetical protein BLNAU_5117 [Blattamonas nauphoetae]
MKILRTQIRDCSTKHYYTLVKADLIPQLIVTLNPQSLSFAEKAKIHTCLIRIIADCFWLTTPDCFEELECEDPSEQQAARETVLKQVVAPSEQYLRHLCVNRYSRSDC